MGENFEGVMGGNGQMTMRASVYVCMYVHKNVIKLMAMVMVLVFEK